MHELVLAALVLVFYAIVIACGVSVSVAAGIWLYVTYLQGWVPGWL